MSEDERQEVWFTPDRTRFYVVPKGLPLPVGDALIRGPLGLRRKRVDLEAMEAWAVAKEEALGLIDERVDEATGRVRDVLGRLVEKGHELTGTPSERAGADEIPPLDPRSFVGVSAGEVVGEADGPRRALSGLLDRAAGTAERIGAGDRAVLRERLGQLEHDVLDEAVPRIRTELGRVAEAFRKKVAEDPDER